MKNTKLIMNIFYNPPKMLRDYIDDNKDLYLPINCGNLKGNSWCDENLTYENELKDNISFLNPKLNEMTTIYSFWKNILKYDIDYVGYQHYRRFFRIDDLKDIEDYDIIDAKPIDMIFNLSFFTGESQPRFVKTDIQTGYGICHVSEDWMKMEESLKLSHLYPFYEEWKSQSFLSSPCNLFIMKKKIFKDYCEFIFPILFDLEKKISLEGRDGYQRRALAFLSERLTSLYIYSKKQQGYKIKSIETLYFEGWKPTDVKDKRGEY